MIAARRLVLVLWVAAGCGSRSAAGDSQLEQAGTPSPAPSRSMEQSGAQSSEPQLPAAGQGRAGTGSEAPSMPAPNGPVSAAGAGVPSSDPSQADAGSDPMTSSDAPRGTCADWEQDLTSRERHAVQALGLYRNTGVVEAVLGAPVDIQGEAYARVKIDRVFYGWHFLTGVEVFVPMAAETHAELGTGSTVLLGLGSTNQQPIANLLMTGDPTPVWTPLSAAVPVGDRDAVKALAAYQPWKAANVGIARIVSQDSARTTFEVLETLAGSLPRSLLVNWPFEWGLPYPGVSADEYIISVDWFGGPGGVATMPDLRPNDSVNRALVVDALTRWKDASAEQAAYRAQLERAAELANELGTAFLYNRAELVANLEVRGRAFRCCDAANQAIIVNHVLEPWKGAPPDAPLITFSEGAVLNDTCGDRFIYALGAPFSSQPVGAEQFSCANVPTQVEMPVRLQHYHRLPFSDAGAAKVKAWLASEAPLYQLHPEDRAPSAPLFHSPNPTALWSSPLPPEVALASGPLVIVTVQRTTLHPHGHEVVLKTQLAGWRLEHLEEYALKLFFRCGDSRWLQVGTTWLVPLGGIGSASPREQRAELIAAGKAFIVPGLMLPNRTEIHQAAQALRTYPDAGLEP